MGSEEPRNWEPSDADRTAGSTIAAAAEAVAVGRECGTRREGRKGLGRWN